MRMCKELNCGGVRAPLPPTMHTSSHHTLEKRGPVKKFMMQELNKVTVLVVVVVFCVLISCSRGQYQPNKKDDGTQALVNQTCSPPFGYLRNLCGPETILDETREVVPIYLYG